MIEEPRTTEQIYQEIKSSLTDKITKLSNFTENSFNYVFTQSYASQLRELELQAVASQLSGYIDYADGNLTQSDLQELGLESFVDDPDEINKYMSDSNLDELVREVGVTRRGGDFATGEAEFTTQLDETVIPENTVVTTSSDGGDTLEFETTERLVVPEGITNSKEVTIQALQSGEDHNLPEGSIIRVKSPPVGVKGVINTNQTSGGTEEETNDELRARAKQAVPSSSLGGTETGIKAFIRQNVEGVEEGDVIIDEQFDASPSFVDVIVDGGTNSEAINAIESSRPTGIRHNLVRPETVTVGADVSLLGSGYTTSLVETKISDFLGELNIGENFFRNNLIRAILTTDTDIINVERLDTIIERVTEEKITYNSSVDIYQLDFTYEDTYGEITVEDKSGTLYTEGEDFNTIDDSGDGYTDSIEWTTSSPSDGEQFIVSYDVTVIGETLEEDYYTATDVRDEPLDFTLDTEYQFEYQDTTGEYPLPSRPFDGTMTVIEIDDSGTQVGDEFVRGESWQLAALEEDRSEDTFTFDDTQSIYQLTDRVSTDQFSIIDETDAIYQRDTDYTVIDTDSDGVLDAIDWGTVSGETPEDGEEFTVSYGCCTRTIQWDQSGDVPTPTNGGTISVTYDQKVYETKYEIVESKDDSIRDESGDVYEEGVDYILYDTTGDNEDDSILWLNKPSTLSDGETFYFSYVSEGDIFIEDRAKVSPGTISVE